MTPRDLDLPAAAEVLYTEASPETRELVGWYATAAAPEHSTATGAAVLFAHAPDDTLRRVVLDGADWCRSTASAVLAAHSGPHQDRPALPDVDLWLDPELQKWAGDGLTLPLLDAVLERAGRLAVIAVDDLAPTVGGRVRLAETPIVVELARPTLALWGRLVPVWRHEVAHILDPRHDPRGHDELEAFADALAVHLAGLPAATDLAILTDLAEQVYRDVRRVYASTTTSAEMATADRADTWPPPGVESVVLWLSGFSRANTP